MKFKTKTKDCHLIVRVKMSYEENIDKKELNRFSRIYLRNFMKPKLIKQNKIEYTGPVGISLYNYLKNPISKRDFFFIIEHTVVAIQKLHSNNFSLSNLVFDIENTFINEVTKEIQFLYVPLVIGRTSGNVLEFIESIVYSVIPLQENDPEYISRFIYFFKGLKFFDPEKLDKYIAREDRSIVNTIKKNNIGQSGFMTDKPQHYYDHYNVQNNGLDDSEQTDLLYYDEATGLLGEEDKATDILEQDDEATDLLSDDEGTALLNKNLNILNVRFPTLYRVLTEEIIKINKPVFRIGKENSYVDYFVTNNNAVSRSHADIITRGDKYFIIDLNSKNRTFINDQPIPVQIEVEIYNEDKIRLANEEFIFNV